MFTDSTAMLADFFKQRNDILSQLTPSSQPDSKASYTVFYLIYWADSDHGASPRLLYTTTLFIQLFPQTAADLELLVFLTRETVSNNLASGDYKRHITKLF